MSEPVAVVCVHCGQFLRNTREVEVVLRCPYCKLETHFRRDDNEQPLQRPGRR